MQKEQLETESTTASRPASGPHNAPKTAILLDRIGLFRTYFVKYRKVRVKIWGCLLTSKATRAIHLEVLESLEANALLMAICKFVERRGRPEWIHSENGSNLV